MLVTTITVIIHRNPLCVCAFRFFFRLFLYLVLCRCFSCKFLCSSHPSLLHFLPCLQSFSLIFSLSSNMADPVASTLVLSPSRGHFTESSSISSEQQIDCIVIFATTYRIRMYSVKMIGSVYKKNQGSYRTDALLGPAPSALTHHLPEICLAPQAYGLLPSKDLALLIRWNVLLSLNLAELQIGREMIRYFATPNNWKQCATQQP
jgi:hypothetical protein